jgi:hypothetical protein
MPADRTPHDPTPLVVKLHPYAVPPEDRAEAARQGLALFPFGRFAFVPLIAREPEGHPNAGAYVIPMEKLLEAERKASARLQDARATNQPAGVLLGLQLILDRLADEMERRTDAESGA